MLVLSAVGAGGTGVSVFIDNGIITLIVSLMSGSVKRSASDRMPKTDLRVCVDSFLVQILDVIVNSKSVAFDQFRDLGGFDLVFSHLIETLKATDVSLASISLSVQSYILSVMNIFCECFRGGRDSRWTQIIKSAGECENISTSHFNFNLIKLRILILFCS